MGAISRGAIFGGALLLIIVGIAILRFLIHELVRFVEISAILVIIVLVMAWLLARRAGKADASRP